MKWAERRARARRNGEFAVDKLNWQVGVPVTAVEVIAPGRKELVGRYIKLTALEPQADSQLLYPQTHGGNESERIWTYMSYGPFGDAGEMAAWMSECVAAILQKICQ